MIDFVDLWVYLSGSPLLWLTVTLTAYVAAEAISVALGRHPLANPVLISVVFVSAVLVATRTSLFRRRPVRAFPAWAGDGGARRAAGALSAAGAPHARADAGRVARGLDRGHRLVGVACMRLRA
jgi:hypothetical protein